jgi:hypothetical protein
VVSLTSLSKKTQKILSRFIGKWENGIFIRGISVSAEIWKIGLNPESENFTDHGRAEEFSVFPYPVDTERKLAREAAKDALRE